MAELPNMKMTKNDMPTQDPKVRAHNFEEVALGYDEATAIDEAKRCLHCVNMPCVAGCPVKIHIPDFINKIRCSVFTLRMPSLTLKPHERARIRFS